MECVYLANIDLTQLDQMGNEKERKAEQKRRKVTDRFHPEKKKTVTSISVPTPLLRAIDEYCSKTGMSKAAFFSQAAREKLKNEDLETEF
jgi:hypothetical protein